MLCGLYELDITPTLGMNVPGYFVARVSAGIRDALFARALACSNEAGDAFILVNLDTISISLETAAKVRARVEQMIGVAGERVMVSATHTHTGGPVDDFVPGMADANYMDWMARRAADAAVLAWENRREAKLGYGETSEDSISFIRRYYMKDGTLQTNPGFDYEAIDRPAGEIDPQVSIVKIEDMQGRLMCVVTNFACHLDTVSGCRFSADYPGELSRVLKAVYGSDVVSIFLTGACGNINHYDYIHRTREYYANSNPPHYVRMGRILAGDVIRALADIETQPEEKIAVENAQFAATIRTPSAEDIAAAQALLKERPYEVVVQTEKGTTGDATLLVKRHYARSLLEVAGTTEKQVSIPVQTARLGQAVIVGLPCELFVEFGLDIKQRSGAEHTLISTLTSGDFGYIAVREAFAQGGYETSISGSTKMAPQTGYDMADTAVSLIEKL